jgi:hypothetical protein
VSQTGTLIALEGRDDVVLDTLLERLYRWLRSAGIPAERADVPTRSPIGALLRLQRQGRLQLAPPCQALLWTADRLDQLGREEGLRASLAKGCVVLAAHYLLSGYSLLADQVDLAWLEQINAPCDAPGLTLYIGALRAGAPLSPHEEHLLEAGVRKGGRVTRILGCETIDAAEAACREQIAAFLDEEGTCCPT